MTAQICRALAPGGAMLYDASRIGNALEELTNAGDWAQHWAARHASQPVPAGRGSALFIDGDGRQWVLRHYRRGGFLATLLNDRYFWSGEESSRPFREWRLLHEMHSEGLPVPAPVAAHYRRVGPIYRADLITERIANASPLSTHLAAAEFAPQLWGQIGACVRRFHDRGIWHADLNAHNILIDAQQRIWVIDFDRGRRRAPGAWTTANLQRLQRSLQKIAAALPAGRYGDAQWQALVAGYSQTKGR